MGSITCFFLCRYWPFGQDGCSYHGFQGMISILASISFLAAIAWDRYHQYCTSEYIKAQVVQVQFVQKSQAIVL